MFGEVISSDFLANRTRGLNLIMAFRIVSTPLSEVPIVTKFCDKTRAVSSRVLTDT